MGCYFVQKLSEKVSTFFANLNMMIVIHNVSRRVFFRLYILLDDLALFVVVDDASSFHFFALEGQGLVLEQWTIVI